MTVLRQFFARRATRKAFSNILKPGVTDKILSESDFYKRGFQEAQIDFVCASVRGETPEIISERMGLVSDLAVQQGGIVYDLISGIVIIAYVLVEHESDPGQRRANLCNSARSQLATNVKMVHGTALGHHGLLGNSPRMSFSFIVPGFLDALAKLAALPYGETCELKNN